MAKQILLLLSLVALAACGGRRTSGEAETGDTLLLRHARGLTIVEFADRTEVTLRNPWDTLSVMARYTLVQHTDQAGTPSVAGGKAWQGRQDASVVTVPLRKAAVFSSVHCALLHELGADSAVGGICDFQFFNLPYYKQAVADGTIVNLGNSLQPSLEQMVNLSPDAIMPSPFENSGGLGRIERLGIPIIWCADYMEETPLGRAEWIRFYGRLVGRASLADSIFSLVEHRYEHLRKQAMRTRKRPRLLPEMPWSGQWTLPSAGSSSARLYADAGAQYLFAHLEGRGGIPLSTEKVVDKAVDADFWLIKHHGPLDRAQMNTDTPLLADVKAPIWWCDTSEALIYEETPFHPERLLENLVSILHPELGIRSEHNYFKPL